MALTSELNVTKLSWCPMLIMLQTFILADLLENDKFKIHTHQYKRKQFSEKLVNEMNVHIVLFVFLAVFAKTQQTKAFYKY